MRLKKTYNLTLERYKNAEIWIDDKSRTENEIKRHMQKFKDIAMTLGKLLNEIGDYTHEEAVNGFQVS